MKSLVLFVLLLLCSTACYAQELYEPYSQYGYRLSTVSRYDLNPPRLYSEGRFIGELSADRYAPDSVSNVYGRYGSRYSPDSINNRYGPYGRYSTQPIRVYQRRW